jgi:hypothetical protein
LQSQYRKPDDEAKSSHYAQDKSNYIAIPSRIAPMAPVHAPYHFIFP